MARSLLVDGGEVAALNPDARSAKMDRVSDRMGPREHAAKQRSPALRFFSRAANSIRFLALEEFWPVPVRRLALRADARPLCVSRNPFVAAPALASEHGNLDGTQHLRRFDRFLAFLFWHGVPSQKIFLEVYTTGLTLATTRDIYYSRHSEGKSHERTGRTRTHHRGLLQTEPDA
jgi:hypothetical protein